MTKRNVNRISWKTKCQQLEEGYKVNMAQMEQVRDNLKQKIAQQDVTLNARAQRIEELEKRNIRLEEQARLNEAWIDRLDGMLASLNR